MSDTQIADEKVRAATGRGWDDWFSLLDAWGAAKKGHKATAAHLATQEGVSPWWSQMITVGYERARGLRKVGQTTKGYQVGARRTLATSVDAAWTLVSGAEGLAVWLGEGAPEELVAGETYLLDDGTAGEVRVVEPGSHLRLSWQPSGWETPSTLQVRVLAAASGKGTVSFHHENLPDADAREAMRAHWKAVLGRLAGISDAG